VTWSNKFDYIRARRFDELLSFWGRRSPVGIEIGQNRLAEHIEYVSRKTGLPQNGVGYLGPIDSRTLVSELYCGVTKAFNLSFHAQWLAKNQAFTNGSLHSFNSVIQFMCAIMSVFGVFIIRIGGKYFVVDVFPWFGYLKEDRNLSKRFGEDWWRYARIIADKKETIEQREIAALFQRCLKVASVIGWREVLVGQLIDCENRWFNRPRNNILYNFTGWTESADLMNAETTDIGALLRTAVRTLFDPDAQMAFGPLPQSLLLGSLLTRVWSDFRESVVMELNGVSVSEFPPVGDSSLIGEFESVVDDMISSAV
jgi:hypothetical protein